jgi:hypothetical protein
VVVALHKQLNDSAYRRIRPAIGERQCWLFEDRRAREAAQPFADRAQGLLPGYDGELVADALRLGSHVFLTEDRGILAESRLLFSWGISVLRPGELLDALEDAGELECELGGPGYELAPDLLSLSRFYAIAAS